MTRSSSKQPKPDIENKRQNERQRLEKALEEGLEEIPGFRCSGGDGAGAHEVRRQQ